ncbi:MAG: hypothetical protein LAO03_06275 [Acidobacteriia bacterium]|nr:hypothetical protein [Terriglobia bacterium]
MRSPTFLKSHGEGRNPYFHFHPLQSAYSLMAALVLLGILLWVLAGVAR